jgi:hypothetical protein
MAPKLLPRIRAWLGYASSRRIRRSFTPDDQREAIGRCDRARARRLSAFWFRWIPLQNGNAPGRGFNPLSPRKKLTTWRARHQDVELRASGGAMKTRG